MAEKEYIERGAFRKKLICRQIIMPFNELRYEIGCVIGMLDKSPTADVVEVRHGRWIWTESGEEDYEQYWVCSCCGEKEYIEYNYCPNCGAKMDGKGEGE